MSKKALFIVNPHSGKGLIKNYLLEIVDKLVKADYEVTIYTTQARKDAERVMLERDRDYALAVCSGGDGTLDEIVTGMIKSGFGPILVIYQQGAPMILQTASKYHPI